MCYPNVLLPTFCPQWIRKFDDSLSEAKLKWNPDQWRKNFISPKTWFKHKKLVGKLKHTERELFFRRTQQLLILKIAFIVDVKTVRETWVLATCWCPTDPIRKNIKKRAERTDFPVWPGYRLFTDCMKSKFRKIIDSFQKEEEKEEARKQEEEVEQKKPEVTNSVN